MNLNHLANIFKKNKLILIVLILFLLILIFTFINKNHINIIEAYYGEIEEGFKTKALVIREEKVFKAPTSGKVNLLQEEGARVSYNEKVIKVGGRICYSKKPGIISYAFDNLEKRLNPSAIEDIKSQKYDNFKRQFTQIINGDYINRGEFAYRIINNFKQFLMLKIPFAEARKFKKKELVFIDYKNLNSDLIKGEIINKYNKKDNVLMLISLKRFMEDWANVRWVNVKLIKDIYRGIVLPREAVFSTSEGQGVLVLSSSGKYSFKKINIKEGNQDQVIISGLKIGEKIVRNPEAVDFEKGGKN